MMSTTTLHGVGAAGMSWTFHVSGTASPSASASTIARDVIPQRKRHAAAANVASVNRGTT